ncbi:glycosyltransferase [Polluticoccus soli]|uniref:glycosyltransferase n=1 Tax=Polluticoccus soli TaxID=3034150 RepID=UPI0023E0E828|nr:glycosyltransferase [Flavipsychrobacter sp. JY13-12]
MPVNATKPSILIVLNKLPDELSFLTAKFIGLSKHFEVDIVAWDTKANRAKYYGILRSYGFSGKIYLQPDRFSVGDTIGFIKQNLGLFALRPARVSRFVSVVQKLRRGEGLKRLFFNSYFLKSQHDIWHFEFGAISPWYSYLKEIFPDRKLTVSFRGYDLNYVGLNADNYYGPTWQRFDGFHFLGQDLRNRAIKRGYAPGRIEAIIPPAIDTTFFNPGLTTAKGDKLVIVSTGRLVWKKGYEYGIRAAAILKQNGIPFEYRIIGDGDHLQALQYTISELGLEQEVRLLGRMQRSDVRTQLQLANVFLHPAISEGFCNAVLEAQAMGVPVVCTDADGLAENVIDGETGFVVKKWDINAMVEKLTWCYRNTDQAASMGRNGTTRVINHFAQQDQIKSFVQFYNRVHQS